MFVFTSVDREEMNIVNLFFDTFEEAQQSMAKAFSEDANIDYEKALDIITNDKSGNVEDNEKAEDVGWDDGDYVFHSDCGWYQSSSCGTIVYQIEEVKKK